MLVNEEATRFFDCVLRQPLGVGDQQRIRHAYWLAHTVHAHQRRMNGDPYVSHPIAVARDVFLHGWKHPDTLCAALLHDAVEDGFVPESVYVSLVGACVWSWIVTLSKKHPVADPLTGLVSGYQQVDDDAYFDAILRLPDEGRVVKVADRLHNLRTMEGWTEKKQQTYRENTAKYVVPIADLLQNPHYSRALRDSLGMRGS